MIFSCRDFCTILTNLITTNYTLLSITTDVKNIQLIKCDNTITYFPKNCTEVGNINEETHTCPITFYKNIPFTDIAKRLTPPLFILEKYNILQSGGFYKQKYKKMKLKYLQLIK